MKHSKNFLVAALVGLLLAACAPVADTVAGAIDTSDGATLSFVLRGEPGGPGVAFDPDGRLARGVILRVEGDDLDLVSLPPRAECTVTRTTLDCRLGDVTTTVVLGVTGRSVVANATYRRTGSPTVYLVFAR